MPVSIFDPATQRWVSGNFDGNPAVPIKSDSDAAATAAAATLPSPWQHGMAFSSHSASPFGGPRMCCVPSAPCHLPVTTTPMAPWCAGGAAPPPHQTLSGCGGGVWPSSANAEGGPWGWQCGACEADGAAGSAAWAGGPRGAACSSHGGGTASSLPLPPLPMPMPAMATGCGGFVSATDSMEQGQQDAVFQRQPVRATHSVAPAQPTAAAAAAAPFMPPRQ